MNSLWLVITALAAFVVAYRLYGAFLAAKVAVIDDRNATPAHRLRDGVDYHPTKKLVLFGHHFAAIAGPGPLLGPVLAAQWGYLPGFSWIVIGACLAGGVHDFVILTASVRSNGLTLPKIARNLIGPVGGATTAIASLFIVIAVLASVAIVVVNVLNESSWSMFTILSTIPAALITGAWMYKIRPGRVGEASIIGVTIVMAGVLLGQPFQYSWMGHYLIFDKETLCVMLPIYAAIASILPVWVLMCPRDYLSSYMKVGVVIMLAAGIFVAQPSLKMPATTMFLSGGGPVVSGSVWPFVCIVIMCGALSGFHALIASGTTPKMINKESDILPIGYGAMILEGFVALTALIAACALEPGDYFKINLAQDKPAEQAAYGKVVEDAGEKGWDLQAKEFDALQEGTGEEKLAGRTGGAVTLAVGMSKVFAHAWMRVQGAGDVLDGGLEKALREMPGMKTMMAYWYHFVTMFEAMFILTLLETGTRVARFVFQEMLAQFRPEYTLGNKPQWGVNVTVSVVVCALWGGLLYIGNLDTLWKMLGIANQLLATIALAVGTTYLMLYAPKRIYAFCTFLPFVFTLVTTFTASVMSIRMWWNSYETEIDPTKSFLLLLACCLAAILLVLTAVITFESVRRWIGILQGTVTTKTVAESEVA
jgi:carbon starvation protein